MNSFERSYLILSFEKLQEVLPESPEELLRRCERDLRLWLVEAEGGLVFCRFSFEALPAMERIILLVYDEAKRIIADAGAYHLSAEDFLERRDVYDYLSEESDWMYLLHYVLSNTMFETYPYPFCLQDQPAAEPGDVLLYTNAYVSRAFRRRGIFRMMVDLITDHAVTMDRQIQTVYSAMSMDPDVACYGPDAEEEPYYYSFEADEPVRLLNAQIASRIGFTPIRLEPDDPEAETDGTKLWFCIRNEVFEFVDEDPA